MLYKTRVFFEIIMDRLKKTCWIVGAFLALWTGVGLRPVFGQLAQQMVAGFRIPGNVTQGCAPFDFTIINLFGNSTADAVYTVDWGDGVVETYYGNQDPVDGGVSDPIYTPDFRHTYGVNSIDCAYFISIEATNPYTKKGDAVCNLSISVWDRDWRGLAVPRNGSGLPRICGCGTIYRCKCLELLSKGFQSK